MRFRDVPQLTRDGAYKVNVSWPHLERHLQSLSETSGTMMGLELDPDFQRAHVWDDAKRTAYVEFVMRGGKSSRTLLFNCKGWMRGFEGPIQIVDGKQRLEAVRMFLRGDLRAFGLLVHEFEGPMPSLEWDFVIHMNDLPTRAGVLRWYLELNSGGVVHTDDELDRVRALLEKEVKSSPDRSERIGGEEDHEPESHEGQDDKSV
jgi:hypothetical protein